MSQFLTAYQFNNETAKSLKTTISIRLQFGKWMDIAFLFLTSAQNKCKEALYLILTEETFYFFCINPLNAVG